MCLNSIVGNTTEIPHLLDKWMVINMKTKYKKYNSEDLGQKRTISYIIVHII